MFFNKNIQSTANTKEARKQIRIRQYNMWTTLHFISIYFALKFVTSEKRFYSRNLPSFYDIAVGIKPKHYIHRLKESRPQNIQEVTELPPRYNVMRSGKIISLEWEKDKYNNNVYNGAFDAIMAKNRYKKL